MILLWGLENDPPLNAVRSALDRLGQQYFFLDQRAVGRTEVEFEAGHRITGRVRCDGRDLQLECVSACYLRPDDSRGIVASGGEETRQALLEHALQADDAMLSWSEMTPALVVNRPSAMGSNSSKPYQLELIRQLGFLTPETLATTDAEELMNFWKQHGHIIYKSISGVRSIVSRFTAEQLCRLPNLATCPTQFQQYIPGVDYRVHVVGDAVFASEVRSSSDDYRYGPSEVLPCGVPEEIVGRSKALAEALALILAGVDLRRTPEGSWYCFEVNPSPGFTFYDRLQGHPIATAVADLLSRMDDQV
jgi:glutathione synthase/RimK-type ligase-like ATP-grasp enzyme